MNQTEKYRRRSLGVPEWSRLLVKKKKKSHKSRFFWTGRRGAEVLKSPERQTECEIKVLLVELRLQQRLLELSFIYQRQL